MRRLTLPILRCLFRALPATRLFGLKRMLLRAMGIRVKSGARVCSSAKFFGSNIQIGRDTWIGHDVVVFATDRAEVRIGDCCDLAPEVMLITGTHVIGPGSRRAGASQSLPISIGDGSWIGARVTVLPGVRIGKGSVIAAGAVVTGDTDPDILFAGVPAKPRKRLP